MIGDNPPSEPAAVRLRPVSLDDEGLYQRLRGSSSMMKELGGPLPPSQIRRSLLREIEETAAGRAFVVIVECAEGEEWVPAGNITLVRAHAMNAEIGWMLLERWQGRGLMKIALRLFLQSLSESDYGEIHAYPSTSNDASNALCRSLGFRSAGTVDLEFAGLKFLCNDWAWSTQR
ncbi:GNAT family N-acetyltransferase [Frigoribacterium sp. R86507]|uniref:GNAT family N-acetyltransferase n=1 Tax=Frigoribacterium sp. R86507 TaxID=3093850 RepID=UPI0037C91FA6